MEQQYELSFYVGIIPLLKFRLYMKVLCIPVSCLFGLDEVWKDGRTDGRTEKRI
jgi:hypothetical protein